MPHSTSTTAPGASARVDVAGVSISHPARVLWPDVGVTKVELARYFAAIAPWVVPHVEGRPLTLLRCAKDIEGCAFMRHARAWGPSALRRVSIREKTKVGEYLVADTAAALVGLVQMDILEVHTWNTRAEDVERPDRVVFDLDPDLALPFAETCAAARRVRDTLAALSLESYVKTTGGKGLHVVVPIRPEHDWSDCFAFSRALAEVLARREPEVFTTRMGKENRRGKIFVDYLRNNRTNTSVAAFSARARPGAPVSVPLAWKELEAALDPRAFTVRTVPARLRALKKDPWAGYFRAQQRLPRLSA